jgi:hypothetical protein
MDNKILVIGGIAVAALLLLKKKNTATYVTTTNGVTTVKSGGIITSTDGTVTDSNGGYIDTRSLTDQQKTDLVTALDAQNQAVYDRGLDLPALQYYMGIPRDLYDQFIANQTGYALAGKPTPIYYDRVTKPKYVIAIPFVDPAGAVTYYDPDGSLRFDNVNGYPVPRTPVTVATPDPSTNDPDLAYWQQANAAAAPQTTKAPIVTYGTGTDSPYQIINGVVTYI